MSNTMPDEANPSGQAGCEAPRSVRMGAPRPVRTRSAPGRVAPLSWRGASGDGVQSAVTRCQDDLVDTVGAVLEDATSGAGHRPVAARAGLAATTVRRHAGGSAASDRLPGCFPHRDVTRRLVGVGLAAQPDVMVPVSRGSLTDAVIAVLGAATAISRFDGGPVAPWPLAVVHTGGQLLG